MGACCTSEPRSLILRGHYKAKVLKVIDGDTVDLAIRPSWDSPVFAYKARLYGINTPELHPVGLNKNTRGNGSEKTRKLLDEQQNAEKAKKRLEELINASRRSVNIIAHGNEKYGRTLVEISARRLFTYGTPVTFNQTLVNEGHAVVYNGGKR